MVLLKTMERRSCCSCSTWRRRFKRVCQCCSMRVFLVIRCSLQRPGFHHFFLFGQQSGFERGRGAYSVCSCCLDPVSDCVSRTASVTTFRASGLLGLTTLYPGPTNLGYTVDCFQLPPADVLDRSPIVLCDGSSGSGLGLLFGPDCDVRETEQCAPWLCS